MERTEKLGQKNMEKQQLNSSKFDEKCHPIQEVQQIQVGKRQRKLH